MTLTEIMQTKINGKDLSLSEEKEIWQAEMENAKEILAHVEFRLKEIEQTQSKILGEGGDKVG